MTARAFHRTPRTFCYSTPLGGLVDGLYAKGINNVRRPPLPRGLPVNSFRIRKSQREGRLFFPPIWSATVVRVFHPRASPFLFPFSVPPPFTLSLFCWFRRKIWDSEFGQVASHRLKWNRSERNSPYYIRYIPLPSLYMQHGFQYFATADILLRIDGAGYLLDILNASPVYAGCLETRISEKKKERYWDIEVDVAD